MSKYDYKVQLNLSGMSYDTNLVESATSIFNAKPTKVVKDGMPQYTLPMVGTTVDKVSRNGVSMTKAELINMTEKELVTDRLKNGSFYCEMNHPFDEENVKRFRSVDQTNLSHQILEFFFTPGDQHLAFNMRTARTRQGLILANILEDGGNLAVSLRAFANVTQKDGKQFKDIYCVSYDSVFMPSNRESWSIQVMEAADFANDNMARFGITKGEINKFKHESANRFKTRERQMAEKINLIESYMQNTGTGGKIIDFKNISGVKEHTQRIAESASLVNFKPTHIMICESNNEVILMNREVTASVKAERSLMSDIMNNINNKYKK